MEYFYIFICLQNIIIGRYLKYKITRRDIIIAQRLSEGKPLGNPLAVSVPKRGRDTNENTKKMLIWDYLLRPVWTRKVL